MLLFLLCLYFKMECLRKSIITPELSGLVCRMLISKPIWVISLNLKSIYKTFSMPNSNDEAKYSKQSHELCQEHPWIDFCFNYPVTVMENFNSLFTAQKRKWIHFLDNKRWELNLFFFVWSCKLMNWTGNVLLSFSCRLLFGLEVSSVQLILSSEMGNMLLLLHLDYKHGRIIVDKWHYCW